MKQFKIFKNPMRQYEAVKIGWSWPGFFFTWIWAAVKGLWSIFAGLLALSIAMAIIGAASPDIAALSWIVGLGISLALGSNGNAMRETNLTGRGYRLQKIVVASTPEGAIAVYLESEMLALAAKGA